MSEALGSNPDNPENEQNRQDGSVHPPLPYFGEVEKGVYSFIGPESLPISEQAMAPSVEAPDNLQLHICPECTSELVYPLKWKEHEEQTGYAHVWLRCPECEWRHDDEYSLGDVDSFDKVLTDGTEQLLSDLSQTSRANMEEDAERLIDAIQKGHIEPMDF